MDYSKLIDCAAIQTPDGKTWTGKRHYHCIKTIRQVYTGLTGSSEHVSIKNQGFVTMTGDFVDRKTAYKYVLETGQKMKGDLPMGWYDQLYSEHLY